MVPPSIWLAVSTRTSPRRITSKCLRTSIFPTHASSWASTKTTRPDVERTRPVRPRVFRSIRINPPSIRSRCHGWREKDRDDRPSGLDRYSFSAYVDLEGARIGILRTEELQLVVHLRVTGHAGPGDPDRHRHLPGHALQTGRPKGVRVR